MARHAAARAWPPRPSVQRHGELAAVARDEFGLRVLLRGNGLASQLDAASALAFMRLGLVERGREQLQNGHVGFAGQIAFPLAVAQDDFEQLVHRLRPHAFGHEDLRFLIARGEVALVLRDGRVQLRQLPLAPTGHLHGAHDLQPVVQRVKDRKSHV